MSLPSLFGLLQQLDPWRGAPAVYMALLTAVLIALFWDWRLALLALIVQYAAAGLLFLDVIAPQLAFAKLLAGWFACLILAITGWQVRYGRAPSDLTEEQARRYRDESFITLGSVQLPRNPALRLVGTIIMVLVLLIWVQQPAAIPPGVSAELEAVSAAIWIFMGLGLLGLVLSRHPLPAGMSFLTFLTGFDLYYSALNESVTMIAVLAAVTLIVAVVVSYLSQVRRALAYSAVVES